MLATLDPVTNWPLQVCPRVTRSDEKCIARICGGASLESMRGVGSATAVPTETPAGTRTGGAAHAPADRHASASSNAAADFRQAATIGRMVVSSGAVYLPEGGRTVAA